MAVDATLCCKGPVRFDDHVSRDASLPFKTVDVLGEQFQKLALLVK